MHQYNIESWQQVLSLCCEDDDSQFISIGIWSFKLKKINKQKVTRPIEQIIKQYSEQNQSTQNSQHNLIGLKQLQIFSFPQHTNIKDAFKQISIKVNYPQQMCQIFYRFWEINNFKVYRKDENSKICSFEDDQSFYFGKYQAE